jgi:hypothetical protein
LKKILTWTGASVDPLDIQPDDKRLESHLTEPPTSTLKYLPCQEHE